jgi:hypothetical protein
MAARMMYRYEVPVDDQPHEFRLTGNPVAVAAADLDYVEFWAEHDDYPGVTRAFQVFGTGQPLPPGARWAGTCPRTAGAVWHLFEIPAGAPEPAPEDSGGQPS